MWNGQQARVLPRGVLLDAKANTTRNGGGKMIKKMQNYLVVSYMSKHFPKYPTGTYLQTRYWFCGVLVYRSVIWLKEKT